MSTTTPTRPGTEPPVDEETERVLLERDATFQLDKTAAVPWLEARARILEQLKPR